MVTVQGENNRAMQTVDCWPYDRKVIRYAHERPLEAFKRMTVCPVFGPKDVKTDGQGNIIEMPRLIGRPCFGIPPAYLRQRFRPDKLDRKSGKMRPASKCARCKIQKACLKVNLERFKAIRTKYPEFKNAVVEWHRAGGLNAGGFPKAFEKLGEAGWRDVCRWPQRMDFTSSNAAAVASYWQEKSNQFSRCAARARAAQVASSWKEGNDLHLLPMGLDRGHQERTVLLRQTISSENVPKYLRRVPIASAERIAYAWWGREFAKLTGQKTNPNRIAKILISYKRNLGISESSLRSSVASDLDRIDKLESAAQYNGGAPIWPRFTHPLVLTGP